jgi:hypothetical protein
MQTLDFAVVRNFSVTEKVKFQFRSEFFNALNHTNLGTPDRFVTRRSLAPSLSQRLRAGKFN